MRFSLDTQLSSAQAVGARAGVASARSALPGSQLAALLQRVEEAARAGLLPHLDAARDPEQGQAMVARGLAWRHRGARSADRVVLVGEPGACAAAALLARAAGAADMLIVDQPAAELVQAAQVGAKRPRMVVLEGPPWVGELARRVGEGVATWTVFREAGVRPGAEPDLPEGAEVVVAPGAADARFGAVGPAALALAGWARLDGTDLAQALAGICLACTGAGQRSNPALRLALLAHELARGPGLTLPVLLTASPRLADWASWAARAWSAFSARPVPETGGYRARGSTPLVVAAGDEALIQRLIAGPRDHWVLALDRQAEASDALGLLARDLVETHVRQLVRDGRPVVRLDLRDDGPLAQAELAFLWTHAALLAAALDPVDPLTMDAADDWRALLAGHRAG